MVDVDVVVDPMFLSFRACVLCVFMYYMILFVTVVVLRMSIIYAHLIVLCFSSTSSSSFFNVPLRVCVCVLLTHT